MKTLFLSQRSPRRASSHSKNSSSKRRMNHMNSFSNNPRNIKKINNSRSHRTMDLIKWAAVFLACLVVSALYMSQRLPIPEGGGEASLVLSPSSSSRLGRIKRQQELQHRRHSQHRIAMILPYVGEGIENIPSYLSLFCLGAAGASDIADFLIFHNGVMDPWISAHQEAQCPENVIFISLESDEAFAATLLRVLDIDTNNNYDSRRGSSSKNKNDNSSSKRTTGTAKQHTLTREQLVVLLAKQLQTYPYSLVEFKPALGHIFADYLQAYSHWGYTDMDILFGDLARWVSNDELTEYDIVTYGFGDQDRLYLRGQFTFHKNNPKVNALWQACDYLSAIDERFKASILKKALPRYESAEGCYSAAILQRSDIKVKYAVKAWTDIHDDDIGATHGLFLALPAAATTTDTSAANRQILYKALQEDQEEPLVDLSWASFQEKDSVYKRRSEPLQHPMGAMEPIDLPRPEENADCMFWVKKKYQSQLCLPQSINVTGLDNIYWVNGQLYRQRYKNSKLDTPGVATGPFFHFQEWKRFYRPTQLTSMHYLSSVATFVLAKEGAIPVFKRNAEIATKSHRPSSSRRDISSSPLGLVSMNKWAGVKEDDRGQLPSKQYCLVSGPREFPETPPAPQCYQHVSWHNKAGEEPGVEILSGAPAWKGLRMNSDVTLVLTLQITAAQSKDREAMGIVVERLTENIEYWQGQPCVAVVYVAGATEEALAFVRQRFGSSSSDLSASVKSKALVAMIFREDTGHVSRKALMNMGIDAVPTRWYISGLELERGLSLSAETAFFAHRAAKIHTNLQGNIFLIPQFALTVRDEIGASSTVVSLKDLSLARKEEEIKFPSEFEEACEEEFAERVDILEELWWDLTIKLIMEQADDKTKKTVEHGNGSEEQGHRQEAESLQELELEILKLLTVDRHETLFRMDESPILLIDNMGPSDSIRTSEVIREVEEFGGRRCYNGIRLAQFAAFFYRINVLAGAFSVSTETSRTSSGRLEERVLGDSRCDDCFMFSGEHENILEAMVVEEIQRPAKAGILSDELSRSVSTGKV